MAINCGQVWGLATTLAALADEPELHADMVEPLKRVAVGRAYYAVYHRARIYAMAIDYSDPEKGQGSSHSALWLWFRARGDRNHKRIATLGFAMHDRRKTADYELGEPCPEVQSQLEDGEMLVDRLDPLEDALTAGQAADDA